MVRIGLIGYGSMGETHLKQYREIGEDIVKVVALADIRKERLDAAAEICEFKAYNSAKELIENADVDAVDICLPTFLHTEYAVMAMKNDLHVFVEKPLCKTLDEAQLIVETQKETKKQAMVGHVIRFWPEYMWLYDAAKSGKYGRIESATFRRLSPLPVWSWNNWFLDAKLSGSFALDLHIHDVDYVRYLLGEPKEIESSCARDKDGIISHIISAFKYDDDVTVWCEATWNNPGPTPFTADFRVRFEKATVVSAGGTLTIYDCEGNSETIELNNPTGETVGNISNHGGYFNELLYFVNCLNNNEPVVNASAKEAAKSLELILKEIEIAGGVFK